MASSVMETPATVAAATTGSHERRPWCVGIDFGTRVCSAALLRDGVSVVDIPLSDHERADSALPAFVSVTDTGFRVGADARTHARSGDPSTVFDLVRLVGRKMRDLSSSDLHRWPFKVISGESDKAMVEISSHHAGAAAVRSFHPEELVAVLFRHIKQRAEAEVHAYVGAAVVSIPGGFNHTQRHAVRNACAIAGLRAEALVSAATAAVASFATEALADNSSGGPAADPPCNSSAAAATELCDDTALPQQLVLAVDVGASCTDISLVAVRDCALTVKAMDSALQLGGDDFTDRIAAHCRRHKVSMTPIPPATSATSAPTAATTAADAREPTAAAAATQIRRACELAKTLLSVSQTAVVRIDAPACDAFGCYSLTRAGFDALCADLWQQVLVRTHTVVRDGTAVRDDVTAVILLGGSARIPRLAALVCASFSGKRVVVSPRGVSPARGAAVLGERGLLTLRDVTPLVLGTQSGGGTRVVMIPRNVALPVRETSLYYANCQSAVVVHVLEGRSFSKPSALHCLVRIPVESDRTSPHLVLQIDLAFEVASLDHVGVTIVERASGRRIAMRLTADETSMSAAAVARAHARLYGRIADSTAMVLVPRDSVLQIPHLTGASLLSTHDPMRLLHEYVAALEASGSADKALSCDSRVLSRDDEALVRVVASVLRGDHEHRRACTSAPPSA